MKETKKQDQICIYWIFGRTAIKGDSMLQKKKNPSNAIQCQCHIRPLKAILDNLPPSMKLFQQFRLFVSIFAASKLVNIKQGYALKNWVEGLSDEAFYQIRLKSVNPTYICH